MEIKPKTKIPVLKMETLAVHAGQRTDPATGAVTPPIHLSSTFERDPNGEYPLGFSYAREGNPTRQSLEECLAALEGGKDALAFSSGLAVATALLQGLEPGDHVVAPADVYFGLRQVIGEVFAKWPIETTYVDMTDLAVVKTAMRPNTRLVLIETPSNPLLQISNLAAVARIARAANAITVCDGTFTTPVLQRPLDYGIDMVWHSTTKYISGHSDMTGGAFVTRYDVLSSSIRSGSSAAHLPGFHLPYRVHRLVPAGIALSLSHLAQTGTAEYRPRPPWEPFTP